MNNLPKVVSKVLLQSGLEPRDRQFIMPLHLSQIQVIGCWTLLKVETERHNT